MHRRLPAALFLSALGALSVEVRAQGCAPLVDVERIRAVSANCAPGDQGTIHCRPETASTFVADLKFQFSSAPQCPVELRWSFADGTPPVITTSPTVEHVFAPPSIANGVYPITVQAVDTLDTAGAWIRAVWGSISVTRLTQSAREGSTPARVVISRTDTTKPVTVGYEVHSQPSHYIDRYAAAVTLAAGEGRREIDIALKDDDVFRGGGRGEVHLTTAPGGWWFTETGSMSFGIDDDDPETHYRFVRDRVTASEGAGGVTLELERSGDLTAADTAVVELAQSLDGTTSRYTVPFAPGQTSGSVRVAVTNDSLWWHTIETVATCYGEKAPALTDRVEIVITEDEPLPRLTNGVVEVTETDATREILLPLAWEPSPRQPAPVYAATSDGTAKKEQDYGAIASVVGVPAALYVSITGDDVPESDETFRISFGGPFNDSVTVRIVDDDRPPFDFAFESPGYLFDEAGGTIGIVRGGATTSPASVTLRLTGRLPVSWTIPETVVAFAPGETLKRVPIATDDSMFTNGRVGTLELEWNGFTGASAELELRDDEPMPALSLSDADALEGGTAEFVLTLSGPVGTDIFLTVSTEHGTAGSGDYTPLAAKQVQIPTGAMRVQVPVAVHADGVAEGTEQFGLRVTSCCGGFAQLLNATATATIRESGGPPAGSATYRLEAQEMVSEAAEWLTATVIRRGDTSGRGVAVVKLTAGAARGFTPVTLYFTPGETRKEVRFAIDDGFHSGDAVALLEVFAGTRRDDRREVKIRDDEDEAVLTIRDVTVREPASAQTGQVTFVVTIDPPSFQPIDVELTTAAGTARADLEFVPVTGVRRIPSLATRYELPVTIFGDAVLEATETFTMALRIWAQPGVSAAVGDGMGICSILDNSLATAKLEAYEPGLARGTTSMIAVELPNGAINAGPLLVTSSDPAVVSVPATVPMTLGATSVQIPVTGMRRGAATISITMPVYYQNQVLTAALSVYELHAPVVSPAAIVVEAGSSVRVKLLAAPAAEEDVHVTFSLADGSIAMVENDVTIPGGGHTTFDLAGAAPGQTELIVSFESTAGGTTLRVPVFVTNGQTRRRGARH